MYHKKLCQKYQKTMSEISKNYKEILENSEATWDAYTELYPTLSDFAWKLSQNKLMVGMKFHPKELGKIFYVWLQNDAADVHFDDEVIYSKWTKITIDDAEKKSFDRLVLRLIDMQVDDTLEIKLWFTNSQKSYWLHKNEDWYIVIKATDANMKNARREWWWTAPDPRQDSLDYGARGGNSASPKELWYN